MDVDIATVLKGKEAVTLDLKSLMGIAPPFFGQEHGAFHIPLRGGINLCLKRC